MHQGVIGSLIAILHVRLSTVKTGSRVVQDRTYSRHLMTKEYSGTSELWTPRDLLEVSIIGRCPLYGECTWYCDDPFQSPYMCNELESLAPLECREALNE